MSLDRSHEGAQGAWETVRRQGRCSDVIEGTQQGAFDTAT